METRTREKGTIDCGLQGSVGTLDDMNPTRLSKRSQAVPLQDVYNVEDPFRSLILISEDSPGGELYHNHNL